MARYRPNISSGSKRSATGWAAIARRSSAPNPGLEPWQFYGPSTRRGNRVYLHVLMKPYESVSMRGVKVKHVGDVRPLASTISLKVRKRISAADSLFNHDPIGELVISTPDSALDSMATIIAVDFQR